MTNTTHSDDAACHTPVSEVPTEEVVHDVVTLLKGFADATRVRILTLIGDGEVCVHDIVVALNISQSGVSHQLRVLRDARLVTSRRAGRHVYYRLMDDHVRAMLNNAISHVQETTDAS